MKTIKSKILLLALVNLLNSNLTGCSRNVAIVEDKIDIPSSFDTIEQFEQFDQGNEYLNYEDFKTEPIEEVEQVEQVEQVALIESVYKLVATTNVNIRTSPIDGKILGVLPKDKKLDYIQTLENGWHQVYYYDEVAYVSGDYSAITTGYKINSDIKKVLYATDKIIINIPYSLSESGINEVKEINPLECLEIYEEYDNYYFVKTNDYIGYVAKECLIELKDIFVVVDISDQELRLYDGNELLLRTPVVTGHPSTPSDKGLFEIYNITHNRYLIGPDYKTYVDIMMKYNGGEGLHDSTYHTHNDGFRHGWRGNSEFGGNTYLTDGSHGCINMKRDAVMEVAEYVSEGTKVLVKE